MNFATLKGLSIPEGNVVQVTDALGRMLWHKQRYKTELPYLESTGTQYIDTEVYLTNNHTVEIEYQLTAIPQYQKGIYGALVNGVRYELITRSSSVSSSKGYLEYGYGSSAKVGANTDTERHIIRQEKNTLYVDGVLFHTFAAATFTQGETALLGGFEYTNNYQPALAKYYYCKIWDGDTLVRDYIPVLGMNDVPCMYDRVSGKLFYNQGEGEFEYDRFAAEYQEVKYLESTGTQYIDTGVILTQDSKVEMSVSHLDPSVTGSKIFGSRTSATANNFSVLTGAVGGIMSIVVDFCNYANNRLPRELVSGEAYEISVGKEKLKINTSEVAVSTYTEFATPANAYLFNCSGTYPAAYGLAAMRLHYCRIYDGELLIRDFVPCYRKSDGEAGLYDRVTGAFFDNIGSGEFYCEKLEVA